MNPNRKRRSVQLTPAGIKVVADQMNRENLCDKEVADAAQLEVVTVKRMLRQEPVDRRSAIAIVKALNLSLADIVDDESMPSPVESSEIDNPFYVERSALEAQCYTALTKPGALLRIRAPQKMGKTSLMVKILSQVRTQPQPYQTAVLSFELADQSAFTNLKDFSKWFCAAVSAVLAVENQIDDYWEDILACNFNTTNYFQKYLLSKVTPPLVLALDSTDLVFEHAAIATDFCRLLRTWHDQARRGDSNSRIWQKLRLVIIHATEVYGPLDINASPLAGVGMVVDLPEFDAEQAHTLSRQYGLNWTRADIEQIMSIVGGHCFLLQQAIEAVRYRGLTVAQISQEAATAAGIYSNHLRYLANMLEQSPELMLTFKQVVMAEQEIYVKSAQAFKLHGMGLVTIEGNKVKPRCRLYREYFRNYFSS